jgi:cytochrome b involved in lipid metabolism
VNRLPYVPFIRSLHNNPAKTRYTQAGELGVSDRSVHMPVVDASRPNGGFPEHQRPIVTAGDIRPMELPVLDWQEIRRHNSAQSLWVVIDGEVYDLTVFADKHPGGLPALLKVAGRDASAAFARAGHSDVTKMFKLNFRIGRVPPPPESERLAGDAE